MFFQILENGSQALEYDSSLCVMFTFCLLFFNRGVYRFYFSSACVWHCSCSNLNPLRLQCWKYLMLVPYSRTFLFLDSVCAFVEVKKVKIVRGKFCF